MASLLSIPLELLVAVSSFLNTADFGALRLTCKQVEKSLYEWFSLEFFSKKQFMLTYKSLQVLVDISNHPGFSKQLTHVIIATNVFSRVRRRFQDEEAAARYTQGYQDQTYLLSTGIHREMLTEAFQNLVNLQTVGMRDFDNPKRFRDGTKWSSWGAPTVARETRMDLQFSASSDPMDDFRTRMFQNVVYALGKANHTPPELEVLLRLEPLPDNALYIPDFVFPKVKPVLVGLKKLFIRASTSLNYRFAHDNNGTFWDTCPARHLRRFLGLTCNLEHFRLNLSNCQSHRDQLFFQWLALPALTSSTPSEFLDPPPVHLEHLTTLELGQFVTPPHMILDIIEKFAPTLRNLALWKIDLWNAESSRVHDTTPSMWKAFFMKLLDMPHVHLNHFKVGMLREGGLFVQFRDRTTAKDLQRLEVRQHTGLKMEDFLKELADDVGIVPEESSSDEDDDYEAYEDPYDSLDL